MFNKKDVIQYLEQYFSLRGKEVQSVVPFDSIIAVSGAGTWAAPTNQYFYGEIHIHAQAGVHTIGLDGVNESYTAPIHFETSGLFNSAAADAANPMQLNLHGYLVLVS